MIIVGDVVLDFVFVLNRFIFLFCLIKCKNFKYNNFIKRRIEVKRGNSLKFIDYEY